MNFKNPYNITLDIRGYLDLLFLKNGEIYVCYFDKLKTLRQFVDLPQNTSFNNALSLAKAGYAHLRYSSPLHLHYFLPLTSLYGYSKVANSAIDYYSHMYRVMYFNSRVTFIDNTGDEFKESIIDGGPQFLHLAIKSVI